MSKKYSLLFIALSLLLIVASYILAYNAKREYKEELKSLKSFEVEAHSLARLKKKFDKKSDQRVINSLNRIKQASKDYKKANSRVLVFENLSPSTFSQLLRKIENSTLIVKNLSIERTTPQNVTLRLEIAK
jgi:ABC-type multidrug transport system fused ATPase/permease subunit